jgi:SAM-dependent methyltransferase
MNINYTEVSETYNNHRSYSKGFIKGVIKFGGISDDMRILDLGCGTGNVIIGLQGFLHADIFGVDISPRMLERARRKSLQVICSDIDAQQLPFHDGSFDIILAVYVVHQLNNLSCLLSESFRVLRQEGALVFLTSSYKQIECHHPAIRQFFPSAIDIEKARFLDISKIKDMLNVEGFKNIKHQEVLVEQIPLDQEYLRKVKDKYVSTFHLIPSSEFQIGVKRLEVYIENSSQPELRDWRGTLVYGRKKGYRQVEC